MRKTNLMLTLALAALTGTVAADSVARDLDSAVTLDIAAGPLETAIIELSKQTGMQLVAPTGSLPAVIAPRVSGSMPLGNALELLLQGTQLTYRLVGERTLTIVPKEHAASSKSSMARSRETIAATSTSTGGIRLASRAEPVERTDVRRVALVDAGAAAPETTSDSEFSEPAVVVWGQREAAAEAGYRAKTVSQLGVLGAKAIEDTPFSINVVPPELIENRMATSADQIFRINPVAQLETPQSRFYSGAILRGFSVGWGNQIDGMRNGNNADVEDKERIEIVTGLSAFLYGVGNVGGTINYVLKRPTAEPIRSASVGFTGGENFYGHLDLGGPIDSEGKFGYRLNVVGQDGDTYMDYQSLKRTLVSGAFDWNLADNLKLQVDASTSDSKMRGAETYWYGIGSTPASFALYSNPPDTSRYYGQPQSFTNAHSEHVAARLLWSINETSSLRAAVSKRKEDLHLLASLNALSDDDQYGQYTPWISEWIYPDIDITSAYLFADTKFETGAVTHRLTGGVFGNEQETTPYLSAGWTFSDVKGQVSNPLYLGVSPGLPSGSKYVEQRIRAINYVVGDEITIGDWTALIGLTRTQLKVETFGPTGETGALYDKAKTSPAATLLWRATDRLRLYGNYMTSFEAGSVAGGVDGSGRIVVNGGAAMPPLENKQIEVGAKYSIGGALLTAAVFEIDKALEYYAPVSAAEVRLVQDGRQVHRGVELTVSGRLAENFTLLGGITVLDAKIKDNAELPEVEGSTPQNVARKQLKLYAEYSVPSLTALTFSAGIYHTGEQELTMPNSYTIDAFTTGDLGVRYQTRVWNDRKLTLRFNVNNVTDEQYWLNGTFLGYPRTYAAGAQLQF
ncbi:TonB-dependent siderophore receptor [Steroidobacter sp.]|uniref:TonB-dependent siderophore receptor n=1 Tax=Steroidobacter sp. TaxID=1978227 RepID=UPI001A4EEE23|nr:TonB-dependent receptor [Steroidobacter sp.]MBL8266700.1 TonB-dependent receptor [Steroidobacter sp.]